MLIELLLRGYQQAHFTAENRAFWLKYLKGE